MVRSGCRFHAVVERHPFHTWRLLSLPENSTFSGQVRPLDGDVAPSGTDSSWAMAKLANPMLSMSSRIVIRIDFIALLIIVYSDKVRKIMSDTKKKRIALARQPSPEMRKTMKPR